MTKTDVVRQIAHCAGGRCTAAASDVMTRDVIYCRPNDTLQDVLSKMKDHTFVHIPVVDQMFKPGRRDQCSRCLSGPFGRGGIRCVASSWLYHGYWISVITSEIFLCLFCRDFRIVHKWRERQDIRQREVHPAGQAQESAAMPVEEGVPPPSAKRSVFSAARSRFRMQSMSCSVPASTVLS